MTIVGRKKWDWKINHMIRYYLVPWIAPFPGRMDLCLLKIEPVPKQAVPIPMGSYYEENLENYLTQWNTDLC